MSNNFYLNRISKTLENPLEIFRVKAQKALAQDGQLCSSFSKSTVQRQELLQMHTNV